MIANKLYKTSKVWNQIKMELDIYLIRKVWTWQVIDYEMLNPISVFPWTNSWNMSIFFLTTDSLYVEDGHREMSKVNGTFFVPD